MNLLPSRMRRRWEFFVFVLYTKSLGHAEACSPKMMLLLTGLFSEGFKVQHPIYLVPHLRSSTSCVDCSENGRGRWLTSFFCILVKWIYIEHLTSLRCNTRKLHLVRKSVELTPANFSLGIYEVIGVKFVGP
jgi:hypothetical protein